MEKNDERTVFIWKYIFLNLIFCFLTGSKEPEGAKGNLTPTSFWLLNIFIINHSKKTWRIYSFNNLDSLSFTQIVFKDNKQHIA